MTTTVEGETDRHDIPPPRLGKPSLSMLLLAAVALTAVVHGLLASDIRFSDLHRGLPALWDFFVEATPPETRRLGSVVEAMIETFDAFYGSKCD